MLKKHRIRSNDQIETNENNKIAQIVFITKLVLWAFCGRSVGVLWAFYGRSVRAFYVRAFCVCVLCACVLCVRSVRTFCACISKFEVSKKICRIFFFGDVNSSSLWPPVEALC